GEHDFAPGERDNDKIVRQRLGEKENPRTNKPYFIPAIIGRLDAVKVFDTMTPAIANMVLHKEVRQINEGASARGFRVEMGDPVAEAIIKEHFDATQGGRSLRQLSKNELRPLVTDRLLKRQAAEQPDENGADEELRPMVLGINGRTISLDGFTLYDPAKPD